MKTNELPLRDRIVAHLKDTGEATAAAIAKAVGMADTPSRVTKELNAMRTDAVVEADRKGKGPDLTYWLAVAQVPLPQAALPDNIRAGTRAAQVWQALPEHSGRPMSSSEIVAAIGVKNELIAPVLTEMTKAKQARRIKYGPEYAYTRLPANESIVVEVKPMKAIPEESLAVALAASNESGQPQPEVGQNTGSAGSATPTPVSSAEARAVPEPAPGCATPSASPAAEDDEDEATGMAEPSAADHQLLEQAIEITNLRQRIAELEAVVARVHALLAERVAGGRDPAEIDESECAAVAAKMIDLAVADIVALEKALANKDAELLRQAGLVVELRSRLDAALTERDGGVLTTAAEDPLVDILQAAKAWHVVAKGYMITSAATIKSADRVARQLVRREGETVTVGAWVPMFRFKPSVEVRSAR